MKSLLDHALMAAITVVVIIVLLSWGWTKLQPLLPVLAITAILAALVAFGYHHWRNRYW